MDAQLIPFKFLGLQEGDAHVIRNAGGRASEDAIRSLVISSELLGTREFLVIHHTDCGMLTFTNDELRQKLRNDLGADASGIDFLPFSDLDESVRQDVATIR
jgi:carbonic anhydrase